MKSIFISILLSCAVVTAAFSQIQFCGNNGQTGAINCKLACTYCDLNGLSDTNTGLFPNSTPAPCATGGNMLQSRWYQFIAQTPFIDFTIIGSSVKPAKSNIVAMIVANCQTGHPLACENSAGQPSLTIGALPLVVGQVYQLGIGVDDANAQIDYTIIVSSGSMTPPLMTPLSNIAGPTQLCPFAEGDYSIGNIQNYLTLTWVAPPGSMIDGAGNVRTYQYPFGKNIHIKYGVAGGAVCVTASAYCQPSQQKCIAIINKPIPITKLPEVFECQTDAPYVWPEVPNYEVPVPGVFTFTSTPYASYQGCDSVVQQKITIYPRKILNMGKRFICDGECFKAGGQNFCNEGAYTLNLQTSHGCDSTVQFIVEKIPAVAVIQSPSLITCANSAVTLTNNGSTAGANVTYLWRNGSLANIGNGSSVTVNSAGNYYLIVSNTISSKTCRDTAAVFVSSSTDVPQANAGQPKTLTCTTLNVQLAGSGSTGPQYDYQWTATNGGNITQGSNTLTPTANQPGTYTLLVHNKNNGCTAQSITQVNQNTTPPGAVAAGGTFNCTIPTLSLNGSSGTAGVQYSWTGPNGFSSQNQNPTVSTGGTYNLIVTDPTNGCTSQASANVIADTAPPGAAASGGTLTCELTQIQLVATTGGQNPKFQWSGPGGFSSQSQNPSANQAGNYTVAVTGANGCVSTASATINLDNTVPSSSVAVSGNLNCNNQSVNLIATPTNGAAYNFSWTLPNGSTVSTGATPLLAANAPGNYSLQTTNTQNGCKSTTSASVTQHQAVSAAASLATDVSCFGENDGSVSASGSGGDGSFNFNWSSGSTNSNSNGLAAGTYFVTVTDGEGCTDTASATISQPDVLAANASATPESANQAHDGTATAAPTGGTTPYLYAWENGGTTQTISNLNPGSYNVTVTDAHGCTSVETVTVNGYNCTLSADIQPVNVNCNGENNGSASVALTNSFNPVSYNWSNGATTSSVSGLLPGTYSVSLTDGHNCPAELTFQITEPSPLNDNATATNSAGTGQNTGTATANPTGGTAPYTYLWNNGETTQGITDLAPGFWTVIVTDANGCISVHVVEVGLDNCGLSADFVPVAPSCNGLSNGNLTVALTGGTSPFNYNWSNGGNAATISNVPSGAYTVTVTDANGCQVSFNSNLNQPAPLALALASSTPTICPNDPLGSATVSATGGTGSLDFSWNNGQNGPTATGLVAGSYTVQVTDANNCQTSIVVQILSTDTQAPTVTADNVVIPLGPSGQVVLDLQTTGIQAVDNCLITSIVFSPTQFDCSEQGKHTVTVTVSDASGNTSTASFQATIIDDSKPILTCPPSVTRCFGDDVVNFQLPSASDNCKATGGSFDQTSGLPSGSQFPVGVTTQTYTFTDVAGNVGTCSFEVTILTQLQLTTTSVTFDLDNQHIGAINLTTTGSLSPYTYKWTKDGLLIAATTEDLVNIGAGMYTCMVTDANNCTSMVGPIDVKNLSATGEPSWAANFQLLPNPTSGRLSAIFPADLRLTEGQITVFDGIGRRVFEITTDRQLQVDFDLGQLAEGIYAVQVRIGTESLVRKIVVSR